MGADVIILITSVDMIFVMANKSIISSTCCVGVGSHDGRGAEERAGHQRTPGEDEEEPGGVCEGPAAPSGRGREPRFERGQEAAPEAGSSGNTLTLMRSIKHC